MSQAFIKHGYFTDSGSEEEGEQQTQKEIQALVHREADSAEARPASSASNVSGFSGLNIEQETENTAESRPPSSVSQILEEQQEDTVHTEVETTSASEISPIDIFADVIYVDSDEEEDIRPSSTLSNVSLSAINIQEEEEKETKAETLQELFSERHGDLQFLAENSKYATFKSKERDAYQNITNIYSTKLKISEKLSVQNQKRYQTEVVLKYSALKKDKFPIKEINSALNEAMKNVQKPGIQKNIADFFKPTTPTTTTDIIAVNTEAEILTEPQASSSTPRTTSKERSIKITGKDEVKEIVNEVFDNIKDREYKESMKHVFSLEIDCASEFLPVLKEYKNNLKAFNHDNKWKYDDSKLTAHQHEVGKQLADLKQLLIQYEDYCTDMESRLKGTQGMAAVARLGNEYHRNMEQIGDSVRNKVLEIQVRKDMENLSKHLKKRMQTNESRLRNLGKKPERYFESYKTNATWTEALQSLQEQEPKYLGTTLTFEIANKIKDAFEEKQNLLSMEEILFQSNVSDGSQRKLRHLMLRNLPIIALKDEGNPERFCDARQMLKEPQLILQMFKSQLIFKNVKEKGLEVPLSIERKEGTGKVKGRKKDRVLYAMKDSMIQVGEICYNVLFMKLTYGIL